MGGEGAMIGMIRSFNNNRSLLGSSRSSKHFAYERAMDSSRTRREHITYKKISKEQVEAVKSKYRRIARNSTVFLYFGIFVFMSLIAGVVYLVLTHLSVG